MRSCGPALARHEERITTRKDNSSGMERRNLAPNLNWRVWVAIRGKLIDTERQTESCFAHYTLSTVNNINQFKMNPLSYLLKLPCNH